MGKKTRRFIDKKNAVTFHLVHRSQRDPLAADCDAPQRVLKEVGSQDASKRLEEQRKFGVFYEDDYDYMQHLRNVGQVEAELLPVGEDGPSTGTRRPGIQLPSSVFQSDTMEDIGLLNKAAPHPGPRLDWDPDVVAAMDDDFDFDDPDNALDDDFVTLANQKPENPIDENGDYNSEDEWSDADSMENMMNRWGDGHQTEMSFGGEETRSRYSNYSLSSSVLPRSDKLQLLDDQFDRLLEGYEDNHLGALDEEPEDDDLLDPNSDRLLEMAEEFKKNMQLEDANAITKEFINGTKDSDSENENLETLVIEEKKLDYDCESILSTYSNLYNHPKVIPYQPIKISHKTGLPLNIHKRGLTKDALASLESEYRERIGDTESQYSRKSVLTQLSTRLKEETPEQRKERKQALREYRKERRVEKKANTQAFKDEKSRQEKQMLNVKNQQGIKMP